MFVKQWIKKVWPEGMPRLSGYKYAKHVPLPIAFQAYDLRIHLLYTPLPLLAFSTSLDVIASLLMTLPVTKAYSPATFASHLLDVSGNSRLFH